MIKHLVIPLFVYKHLASWVYGVYLFHNYKRSNPGTALEALDHGDIPG